MYVNEGLLYRPTGPLGAIQIALNFNPVTEQSTFEIYSKEYGRLASRIPSTLTYVSLLYP